MKILFFVLVTACSSLPNHTVASLDQAVSLPPGAVLVRTNSTETSSIPPKIRFKDTPNADTSLESPQENPHLSDKVFVRTWQYMPFEEAIHLVGSSVSLADIVDFHVRQDLAGTFRSIVKVLTDTRPRYRFSKFQLLDSFLTHPKFSDEVEKMDLNKFTEKFLDSLSEIVKANKPVYLQRMKHINTKMNTLIDSRSFSADVIRSAAKSGHDDMCVWLLKSAYSSKTLREVIESLIDGDQIGSFSRIFSQVERKYLVNHIEGLSEGLMYAMMNSKIESIPEITRVIQLYSNDNKWIRRMISKLNRLATHLNMAAFDTLLQSIQWKPITIKGFLRLMNLFHIHSRPFAHRFGQELLNPQINFKIDKGLVPLDEAITRAKSLEPGAFEIPTTVQKKKNYIVNILEQIKREQKPEAVQVWGKLFHEI